MGKAAKRSRLTIGKYVLESLAGGMYSDPLMILREYIQNSADSLDSLPKNKGSQLIEITVDGRKKSLEITDHGVGVPSGLVEQTLLSIGASRKDHTNLRGFRGIGRLGGLGFCDQLVFVTKSQGEKTFWTCTWNAKLLRQHTNDVGFVDLESLIEASTETVEAAYSGSPDDHFFTVKLIGICDSRNSLLNVPLMKSYVGQVAPVPFRLDFSFGRRINRELLKVVPSYKTYRIMVNGEQVFKPYTDKVNLARESQDTVKGIKFLNLRGDDGSLAFGWIAELSLLGAISVASGVDGIRLRCGNILVGNRETFSPLFREARFNHYLVGELHTVDSRLVPNSRRDDFEDSGAKGNLFNEFVKNIGIPYSKEIRELSKERGKAKIKDNIRTLVEQAEIIMKHGYLSSYQRDRIKAHLDSVNGSHTDEEVQLARQLSDQLSRAGHILSAQRIVDNSPADLAQVLTGVLDAIYSEMPSSAAFDKLVSRLYRALSNGARQ